MFTRPSSYTFPGAAALFAVAVAVSAPAYAQGDRVLGSVSSASGDTFEVAQSAGGTATVTLADDARVFESVPAQRGEITAGTCIKAGGAGADSGDVTAKFVAISTAVDGKCPQRPAPAGDASAPPKAHHGVRGVVDTVSGDTLTVSGPSGQSTVTLNEDTHYHRLIAVSAPSINTGKCVAARGTKDGAGVLQASRVTVWANNGSNCPDQPQ